MNLQFATNFPFIAAQKHIEREEKVDTLEFKEL